MQSGERSVQLRPGEEVLLTTRPGQAWYHLAFNLLVGLLLFGGALALGIWWVRVLDEWAGLREIEPLWIFAAAQVIYFGVAPGLVLLWRVESFLKIFVAQAALTNQRVVIQAAPRLWNRYDIALEKIGYLFPEGAGSNICFVLHNGERVVCAVPQRDRFILAYKEAGNPLAEEEAVRF